MQRKTGKRPSYRQAADLIRDAGGQVVGRTRLQKMAYFLEAAGLGDSFEFAYRHYGPYSEELANAIRKAELLDLLKDEERPTSWGGLYSTYSSEGRPSRNPAKARKDLISETLNCNPIALELAATALFLHSEGMKAPWEETSRRKPEKATSDMLEKAQELYMRVRQLQTPRRLPELN